MKQISRQENKHCVVKELKSRFPLRCSSEMSEEMSGSIMKHLFHFILVAIYNGKRNVSLKKMSALSQNVIYLKLSILCCCKHDILLSVHTSVI